MNPDGSTAWKIPFANHRMNGRAEGYHPSGARSFVAHYQNGVLDGETLRYDEAGTVVERWTFVKGKRVEE